jgi:hypothetical protein
MHSATQPTFLEALRKTWEAGTFVKATFSGPRAAEPGLRNLRIRTIELKAGLRLSVQHCFDTSETVRNFLPEEGLLWLAQEFEHKWSRAHLFSTEGDLEFERQGDGGMRFRRLRAAFAQAPSLAHDRTHKLKDALKAAPFLQRLGVCNPKGEPRPGMAGKFRQIQRFVEILGHLLAETYFSAGVDRSLRVADMGAGKGYLTFALAYALEMRGLKAEITGVEVRPELVAAANRNAAELGLGSLRFEAGRIGQWRPPDGLDVLVALHACNTATDDALHLGVCCLRNWSRSVRTGFSRNVRLRS